MICQVRPNLLALKVFPDKLEGAEVSSSLEAL